mgnify:CR=1 FL=1
MTSKQSAQKYMNIMAIALQIVNNIPQMFNQLFAAQDYEEVSSFVTTSLDAYWNDDNNSFLHNLEPVVRFPDNLYQKRE